ncbi:MAG: carboxylating nicotinate-nucleotide diphosphorylase [Gemmatimonadota bacterium]|nr:carboxylating nicotinate-nucleotide diphosphorylase [Gemmatimonadota bacterium]
MMPERLPERLPDRRRTPRTITPLSEPGVDGAGALRFPLNHDALNSWVHSALNEDGAMNDLTTIATVVSERRARARLVARDAGVVCGVPLALEAFRVLDSKITIRVDAEDGTRVERGAAVLFLSGHARGLLSAERVALNFMQHLSGIATLTARYVDAVKGTKARILDTRKTLPGWRSLEKYAVCAGGGKNHRADLSTGILIKDNHLSALDGNIELAVRRSREIAPAGMKVEVECETKEQVAAALAAGADIIMLDNMPPDLMAECVGLVNGRATTEASGGVNLSNVRAIAETGVDWISIGALTHSAPALNLALDFD